MSSRSLNLGYATSPVGVACEFRVDGGTWNPAPPAAVSVTVAADGDHLFEIRQATRPDVKASYDWFADTTPPGTPPGLLVTAPRAFQLHVRWDAAPDAAPTRGLDGYVLQWTYGGTTSSTPSTTGNAVTTEREYTIPGVEATASVRVSVRARDAAGNLGLESVAVARADVGGDGTFAAATVLAGSLPGATDIARGDFTQDRIPDLAVLHGTSTAGNLTVLRGQGSNGRGNSLFVAGATYGAPALATAALGDFDADRQPDLAVAGVSSGVGQVVVFRGGPDGTFTAGTPATLPSAPNTILAVDLDDDAILDLVVGTQSSGVRVLHGNGNNGRGDGTFTATGTIAIASGIRRIAAQDFDDDRNVDLLIAADGGLFLARGTGGGAFAPAQQQLAASIPAPADLLLVDTNGDRVPDPVALSADRLQVQVATTDVVAGCAQGTFTFRGNLVRPGPVRAFASADMDTDQVADLVIIEATSSQQVEARVLRGSRGVQPGQLQVGTTSTPCGTSASAVVLADLDANGAPDILVADPAQGRLNRLAGNGGLGVGDGSFFVSPLLESPSPLFPLVTADFDGDGIPDLATGIYGGPLPAVAILRNEGANGISQGTFAASLLPLTGPDVLVPALLTADLNGDRIPDLVTADFDFNLGGSPPPQTVRTFLGRGDGSFENAVIRSVDLKARQLTTALRRGRADLVVAGDLVSGGSGNLRVLRDDRPTACTPQPNLTTLAPTLAQASGNTLFVRGLSTGDLNGDAVPDLVVSGFYGPNSNGAICVYLGGGSSVIGTTPTTVTPVGFVPEAVRIADFNGDGKMDVLVCNTANDFQPTDVQVLFGDGLGGFLPNPWSEPIARANTIAIADFNGDGITDVAVGQRNSAEVRVLLGKALAGGTVAPFDVQPSIPIPGVSGVSGLVAADLNTDGIQDLAVTGNNGGTGRVVLLLGRGTFPHP